MLTFKIEVIGETEAHFLDLNAEHKLTLKEELQHHIQSAIEMHARLQSEEEAQHNDVTVSIL